MSGPATGSPGAYARALERTLARLQDRPFILSPRDWELASGWHARGIPVAVVIEALEAAAARARRRGGVGGPRSLAYVAGAVEESWSTIRDGRVAGPPGPPGRRAASPRPRSAGGARWSGAGAPRSAGGSRSCCDAPRPGRPRARSTPSWTAPFPTPRHPTWSSGSAIGSRARCGRSATACPPSATGPRSPARWWNGCGESSTCRDWSPVSG